MRTPACITVVAIIALTASVASGTEDSVDAGAFPVVSLLIDQSTRAAGMGGCSAALLDDPAAGLEHPASLAFMERQVGMSGVYIGVSPGYEDGCDYRCVSIAARAGSRLTIGASYTDLPLGTFIIRVADTPEGIGVEFDTGESCVSAAGALRWGDMGFGAGIERIRLDAGLDILAFPEEHDVVYEGWRWNLGLHYEHQMSRESVLSLAASARHLGSELEAPEYEDWRMPACVTLGASARSDGLLPAPFAVHAQVDTWVWPEYVNSGKTDLVWRLGSEITLPPSIGTHDGAHGEAMLRFGYVRDGLTEIDGWTGGGSASFVMQNGVVMALDIASTLPRVAEHGDRLWQIGIRVGSAY